MIPTAIRMNPTRRKNQASPAFSASAARIISAAEAVPAWSRSIFVPAWVEYPSNDSPSELRQEAHGLWTDLLNRDGHVADLRMGRVGPPLVPTSVELHG